MVLPVAVMLLSALVVTFGSFVIDTSSPRIMAEFRDWIGIHTNSPTIEAAKAAYNDRVETSHEIEMSFYEGQWWAVVIG